jgi:hypothetical protein
MAVIDGDQGTDDGVPWSIDKAGIRWYYGECGGCGTRYPTQDWNAADWGACLMHGGIEAAVGDAGDEDLFGSPGVLFSPPVSDAAW